LDLLHVNVRSFVPLFGAENIENAVESKKCICFGRW